MKAIIKIGKVEVTFEVPNPEINTTPAMAVDEITSAKYEFMREAKRLALLLYKETKKGESNE